MGPGRAGCDGARTWFSSPLRRTRDVTERVPDGRTPRSPSFLYLPSGSSPCCPWVRCCSASTPSRARSSGNATCARLREDRPLPVTAISMDPLDNTLLATYESGWVQRLGRAPATYGSICVPTPEGIEGIDPFTGKTLWTRMDVQPAMHCFGDDEYLFLVGRSVRASRAVPSPFAGSMAVGQPSPTLAICTSGTSASTDARCCCAIQAKQGKSSCACTMSWPAGTYGRSPFLLRQ